MENKNNISTGIAVVIVLALVAFLVFISINSKPSENNMNNSNGDLTANTAATGEVAKAGDSVSMNYTGRLQDGTVFDSNVDPRFQHVEPFTFTLGAGQVIAGWDKGIVGMKVGEKRTLTIAPADAYGAGGVPGVIPPNSTLIFDVELIAINN